MEETKGNEEKLNNTDKGEETKRGDENNDNDVDDEINNKSSYIPYRNSMMTMCLRDSLGGNCKTRMIANLSADFDDVLESLSTCRFAQRVALVKNTAVVNEIVDPAILVQKQKNEIEELKAELAMLKGKNQKSFLEQSDLDECEKIVDKFKNTKRKNSIKRRG